MDFLTAVKTCFRKYFTFKGRARRSEYWYWVLFTIVAGIVLGVIDLLIFDGAMEAASPLSNVFNLAVFIPGLAVSWRRLHDINRSGWWLGGGYLAIIIGGIVAGIFAVSIGQNVNIPDALAAILLIVFLLGILAWGITLLVFFCTDTKAGDNRFGEDPKYGQGVSVFD